jgi:hypothetical protein
MEDRFGKYILISILLHIITILLGLQVINFNKIEMIESNEIELLALNDITFPAVSKGDIPRNNYLEKEGLRDYHVKVFDNNLINGGVTDKNHIFPREEKSIPILGLHSNIEKSKTKIKSEKNSKFKLPRVENEFSKIESEYEKGKKAKEKNNYEIISKDLEGRKIEKKGAIPKNLHFSKSEKIILNFKVNSEGKVEDIIPETITSNENLDIAINILNQFRWEKVENEEFVKAKIIFYFKVQ